MTIRYWLSLQNGTPIGQLVISGFPPEGYEIGYKGQSYRILKGMLRDPAGRNIVVGEGQLTVELVARGADAPDFTALPIREAREAFERGYLAAQIARFGGNISRMAAFIGMERTSLHRKVNHPTAKAGGF